MSEYNHKEAFCVMTYQCNKCGEKERIWNTRDGVTPLCISSSCCENSTATHVDWHRDIRSLGIPREPIGRVFMDITKEDAERLANEFWDRRGEQLMEQYEHLKEMGKDKLIEKKINDIYGEGKNPMISTIEKYTEKVNAEANKVADEKESKKTDGIQKINRPKGYYRCDVPGTADPSVIVYWDGECFWAHGCSEPINPFHFLFLDSEPFDHRNVNYEMDSLNCEVLTPGEWLKCLK